ncbi:hypothetical protein ACH429_15220 [Streptomyces pathocidini]|uniref:Uncharacterized protein n=1 Tax=Streptomyces pathocidini TaxID=1650571 RepID=A0ABW7US44_9ACTN|nr:hypothetical protein [Streptomyces pathocidini]
MLAQLPLSYLLLMAALATFIFCFYMDRWLKIPKVTAMSFVISVGCCLGMIAVGGLQYQQWSPKQMLVMYSFGWLGLTVGLIPSRKPALNYYDEWRRGIRREKYEYSKWCAIAPAISVTLMSFLGFILSM